QKEITIYNGSPSEVSKHLINEHNITQNTIIAERPTKKFDLDFESDNSDDKTSKKVSPTKYQAPESKVKKIQRKLLQFIIACNLPFNIVDAKEFQDLLNEIKNEYFKLPCCQTFRYTLLPNMYSTTKNVLISGLDQIKFASITTDIWTSNSQIAYLGLTIHFIEQINYFLKNKVLGLIYLDQDHNKEYLNIKLKETLEEWKVLDRIFGIVSDSGSNMKSALTLFDTSVLRLPCAAHKLNSAVNDLFTIKIIANKFDAKLGVEYFVSEAQINVTNLQKITISSSTPIQTQIPSDQRVRKVRRDLSETEFLSTISDEQPITPILSTNDLKDEFKTYEFLSFNSMHNKRIYKLLKFYRQYKQEIPS
ncbi:unnamed protein product, partial [Brachionus calyciflorus]